MKKIMKITLRNKKLAYCALHLAILLMFTSCVDTIILPDDKTVGEDFWQRKSDVSMIVNKAYQGMLSTAMMQRLIIWSDFRSDELCYVTTLGGTIPNDLEEIFAGQIETDNVFNSWTALYSVINYCNMVLEKSEAVMSIDPNYTNGDYLSDRSQMLALRSLCYFYLVRVFRDVPYIDYAFMSSSQELNVGQTAPLTVIDNCISCLKEAEQTALQSTTYTDWRRVGYLTKDAIRAILADIYLWRASVMHSTEDYQTCINYCNQIIESKKNQYIYRPGETEDPENPYHLAECENYYNDVFASQNSYESIFELQFDGSSNSNEGLCQMYNKYANNNSTSGYLKASSYFSKTGVGHLYSRSTLDQRIYESVYDANGSADLFDVRKMVATRGMGSVFSKSEPRTGRTYTSYDQNWIVYRLTDIMLMKAEALVQLFADDYEDPRAREAFTLVQAVNSRSLSNKLDSLKWNTYKAQKDLESLVLEERGRELCFEGKRWFDLLRYNYRHVDGVEYNTTFKEQVTDALTLGQTPSYVPNYSPMLEQMIQKYNSGGGAVKTKMPTEPYLYMPIAQEEIDVNPNLFQNPVYSERKNWSKQ